MTQQIQRFRDWQSRLAEFLAARESMAFAWGSNDCGLFVADAVQEITGHDPAQSFRGKYTTAKGAASVVKKAGGMAAIGASCFGEEIAPSMAQPGDIGLAVLEGRETLLLCIGSDWAGPGEAGMVRLKTSDVSRAWRAV